MQILPMQQDYKSYDPRATPGQTAAIDHVSVDNFEAGRLAAAHLIEQGHRRIVFATATGQTMSRAEKIRGFFDAARAAGLGEGAHGASVLGGSASSEYGDSEMANVGRLLAARIADPSLAPGEFLFAPSLVQRQSVAAPYEKAKL